MSELLAIKNLGPYTVGLLNRAGIFTREDLLAADYRELRAAIEAEGIQPHLLIFVSIELGLQGRSWKDATPQEREEIRRLVEG